MAALPVLLDAKATRRQRRRQSGQALIELLFIFLIFMAIVYLTIQFSLIANARSMLNLATYAAAREYAVSYSWVRAEAVANLYLGPVLLSGDVLPVLIRVNPRDPGFGRKVTVRSTVLYRLLPIPLVQEYFGFFAEHTGRVSLTSRVDITME